MDISALPLKQANCLELPLESCQGTLLMLVTLTPCSGVSVSDLCVCPLADPSERKQIAQRFVSALPCYAHSPPHAHSTFTHIFHKLVVTSREGVR